MPTKSKKEQEKVPTKSDKEQERVPTFQRIERKIHDNDTKHDEYTSSAPKPEIKYLLI